MGSSRYCGENTNSRLVGNIFKTDIGKIDTEEYTRQSDNGKSILAISGFWSSREI